MNEWNLAFEIPAPAIMVAGDGEIKRANLGALKLLGAEVVGKTISSILGVNEDKMVFRFGPNKGEILKEVELSLVKESGEFFQARLFLRKPPGRFFWVIVIVDVSDKNRDALTGLYNRRYFNETMVRLQRSHRFPVSLIVIDIDDLKMVNDIYGHSHGDICIKQVASTLTESVRKEDDFVIRLGGDEFVIILPDTDSVEAGVVCERVRRIAKEREVSLSLGVATAIGYKEDLNKAFQIADIEMYKNKAERKSAK